MYRLKEKGFAHAIIIVPVLVVAVIGAISWRVVISQQEKQNAQSEVKQGTSANTPTVPVLNAQEQEKLKTTNGTLSPTPESTPQVATTKATPPKPVNNSTNGAVATPNVAPPATTTTPVPTPATPSVQRPTAEFCAQKDGASFTNVWFTGTGTYTYDGYAWEETGYSYSLPRVSKTETGTPLRNYDSMQIFDVVAHGTKPQWAICSDKGGYVMVYYTVPNSPYTFNVLAEYGHLSLQQP